MGTTNVFRDICAIRGETIGTLTGERRNHEQTHIRGDFARYAAEYEPLTGWGSWREAWDAYRAAQEAYENRNFIL